MDQPAGMFFSFSNCEYWCICLKLALSISRGRIGARVLSLSPSSGPFNVRSAFQSKNFHFPKKSYGKQNRSFQQKLFERFPWLRYNEENDSVLCFICAKRKAKKKNDICTKKEEAFLKGGFSNWKKALDKFKEHDYEVNIPTSCRNIYELTSEQPKTKT